MKPTKKRQFDCKVNAKLNLDCPTMKTTIGHCYALILSSVLLIHKLKNQYWIWQLPWSDGSTPSGINLWFSVQLEAFDKDIIYHRIDHFLVYSNPITAHWYHNLEYSNQQIAKLDINIMKHRRYIKYQSSMMYSYRILSSICVISNRDHWRTIVWFTLLCWG